MTLDKKENDPLPLKVDGLYTKTVDVSRILLFQLELFAL